MSFACTQLIEDLSDNIVDTAQTAAEANRKICPNEITFGIHQHTGYKHENHGSTGGFSLINLPTLSLSVFSSKPCMGDKHNQSVVTFDFDYTVIHNNLQHKLNCSRSIGRHETIHCHRISGQNE
jgi:hypothetical protein